MCFQGAAFRAAPDGCTDARYHQHDKSLGFATSWALRRLHPQWNRGQGKVQGGRTGAPAAQLHGGQREGNGVLIVTRPVSIRFPLSRQTGAMVPLGRGAAAFIMLSSAAAFTILSVCFLCAGFAVHCQRTATEASASGAKSSRAGIRAKIAARTGLTSAPGLGRTV